MFWGVKHFAKMRQSGYWTQAVSFQTPLSSPMSAFLSLSFLLYKKGIITLAHSKSLPFTEINITLLLFYFLCKWESYLCWPTWTGIAHRLGHRNKNHMSWLVSMATKLLICPRVISPIDKLDVESLRILLYIMAWKKKSTWIAKVNNQHYVYLFLLKKLHFKNGGKSIMLS